MDPKKEAEVYSEVEFEDIPKAEPETPETPVVTPEPEKEPEAKEEDKDDAEPLIPEPEPEKPVARKRSIYQDLKDKKNEVKTERELREAAERERDAALARLNDSKAPDSDEIEAYAREIDADPEALRKMKTLFLKDVASAGLSPEIAQQLKEFQEFQNQNRDAIDKVKFDEEFNQAVPSIKTLFGETTVEETKAIKAELTKLAHTEQYHDKELDYIAFKNQDTLKALVSPKKRGLESKGRTDATNATTNFDPNADISKMSDKESQAWEKAYTEAGKSEGLVKDSMGRSIFI